MSKILAFNKPFEEPPDQQINHPSPCLVLMNHLDEFLISAILAKALYFSTYIYNKKASKPTQKYRFMPYMDLHPLVCKNKELEDLKSEIGATKLLCFCFFSFRTQPIKLTSMFLFFSFF